MGINCLWIPPPQPAEEGFQAHFQPYFIKSICKSAKLYIDSFDSEKGIPAQEQSVSVSAGRFSIVSESGSWRNLHIRAWGDVRLFLCSYVTSCTDRYPVRGHNAPSVRLSKHHQLYPAGNQTARQMPRTIESSPAKGHCRDWKFNILFRDFCF